MINADDLPAAPRLHQVASKLELPADPVTDVFSRCRWCGAFHLMDCPFIVEQEWYESGAKKRTVLMDRSSLHKEFAFYSEEELRAELEKLLEPDEPA